MLDIRENYYLSYFRLSIPTPLNVLPVKSFANGLNMKSDLDEILMVQYLPPIKEEGWLGHAGVDPGVVQGNELVPLCAHHYGVGVSSSSVRVCMAGYQLYDPVRVVRGDVGLGQLHHHLLLGHLWIIDR